MSKNKILIVKIFFSLIFFYNCSNQQIIPSNIEKVVNKYYEGFLKNDSAMMVSLLDKNYKSVGWSIIRWRVSPLYFLKSSLR